MRKKLIWAMLLIPLLVIVAMANMTVAQVSTTVSIDPPIVWDPNMQIGDTFTVDVVVDYVYKLQSYQIELGEDDFEIPGWDPLVLHLVSVENGPFLGSAGGKVKFFPGEINNDIGTLSLTIGALDPARRFPTGGGVLATLTFELVGDGCTTIDFGLDSGLLDYKNRWVVRGTIDPSALKPGFFHIPVPGPELEFPHGVSGVWEEYQTILVGETQTSYAMVRNWGQMGAWIKVVFIVEGPDGVTDYTSEQVWVEPRTQVGEELIPGEVTVSADYVPGSPGKYYAHAALYFKAGCMEEKLPYSYVEDTLGGEAITKPTNVAFKVKTHL